MPPVTPPPPPSTTQSLAPADVLAMARTQSETADPFAVNGGVVAVTPVGDETSDPITVSQ